MNRFFTLLLAASCLTAVGQDGLIGEVYLSFQSSYNTVEIDGCEIGLSYVLQIEGTYGVANGSCNRDAAFGNFDDPEPLSQWVWNDVCDGCQINRPTPDIYNPNHSYSYPFVAASSEQTFHFQDLGGAGDNCGGLTMRIFVGGNPGCTDTLACNFDADAALDDGSCHFNCQFCHDGTVWDEDLFKCVVANPADSNFDGCVQLNDLLDLLSAYGDCGAEESPWQCGDLLEYQGYDYETVQIGEQCWFAENLRAENFKNGDVISSNLDDGEWASTSDGAVTYYNLESINIQNYGKLFNWHAASDARGLCPSGWNVPSENEWQMLEIEIGVPFNELNSLGLRGTDQGTQLKAQSDLWNTAAGIVGTDVWGYHGLPGGERVPNEGFIHLGNYGFWWTTTLNDDGDKAFFRELTFNHSEIYRHNALLNTGMSIRCIKDTE